MIEEKEPLYIYDGTNIKFYQATPTLLVITYLNPQFTNKLDFKVPYAYDGFQDPCNNSPIKT